MVGHCMGCSPAWVLGAVLVEAQAMRGRACTNEMHSTGLVAYTLENS